MKRRLIQIGLLIVIVAALSFMSRRMKPEEPTIDRILVDTVANKVFVQKFKFGEKLAFPVESPFSEGKNAYPVDKCSKCGTIFAFDETLLYTVETPDPVTMACKCPSCGNSRSFENIEIPEGQKSVDVPGPVQIVKPGGAVVKPESK